MSLPIEDSTTKLENVFEIQHSRGIVETNFGLKFQKINIDFQKCLLLLAGVCPDVSHKADYSPNNKRYIQVFHKREFKVKSDLPPEGRAKIKRHGLLHTSPLYSNLRSYPRMICR